VQHDGSTTAMTNDAQHDAKTIAFSNDTAAPQLEARLIQAAPALRWPTSIHLKRSMPLHLWLLHASISRAGTQTIDVATCQQVILGHQFHGNPIPANYTRVQVVTVVPGLHKDDTGIPDPEGI
jgi:hypothetical protein